jgi:hypothetical protein
MAERFGLMRMLRGAGLVVAIVPLVWAASTSMPSLVTAHVLGGIGWALLEYSSFQLLLEASPSRVRAEFLALAGTLNGTAQLAGSSLGGFLLASGYLDYRGVFCLSALWRGFPLLLLGAALPRAAFPRGLRHLYTRLVSVRPVAGAAQRPLPTDTEEPSSERPRTAK